MIITPSKSPLMYPGGKTRAIPNLSACLPPDLKHLVSPFFGGGSFEISCADAGIKVSGYDGYEPIVNFWNMMMADAAGVAKIAKRYHDGDRSCIRTLVNDYDGLPSKMEKAAAMYVISRCAFSSLVMSRWVNPHHRVFRVKHITDTLAKFKAPNLTVRHADFTQSIAKHPNDFLYLDPPYDISSALYGKDGSHHAKFPHKRLADLLTARGQWMLSYNDCPRVRLFFEGYRYSKPQWAYSMRSYKTETHQSNELLIFSNDIDLSIPYETLSWAS